MTTRRCGPPAICSLIHALKDAGTRLELVERTGQAERTVGEWVRQFRAEGLVRVVDLSATGAEIYKWIEQGEPAHDTHRIARTPEERSASWRKRRVNNRAERISANA